MADPRQAMPIVGVVMGSKSDEQLIQPTVDMLEQLGVPYEVRVISAHRTPEKAREYGLKAQERGLEVLIACAGAAAHLPGVLASWTMLPVIGVPLPTSDFKGVDSLLSMIQMPGGVPVACVAIGSAGAKNAALFAAQMLGLKHDNIREAYAEYRKKLAQG